jgi:hypothetical protein
MQGTSKEAPIPCIARAPISIVKLGAAPHAIEATTKRIDVAAIGALSASRNAGTML